MLGKSTRNHHYGVSIAPAFSSLILVVCLCLFCFTQPARAAVVWSGDIDPDDPTTWTSSTYSFIGKYSNGTLNITDGSNVLSKYGHIGGRFSTGEVTVDGAGSTWTNHYRVYVGDNGRGTLNITGGGAVSGNIIIISDMSRGVGQVTVDGAGSTLNGIVMLGQGGNGILNITGGGTLNGSGTIGSSGSGTGTVTVDGAGSTWMSNTNIKVGNHTIGHGTLNITDGGVVSSAGVSTIENGPVTVDGVGSTWTNRWDLAIGYGTLNITGGGLVSVARTLRTPMQSSLINMSTGGMLALDGEADDSLVDFLGLIDGTDAIRYWDDSISDWADIMGATYGRDYTLNYLTEGDLDGYTVLTVDNLLTNVSIDIKPGGDTNNINLDSNGNIAVAIFSTDDFDATTVDPATITLADARVKARGKRGDLMSFFKDVDLDGLLDLLVHIDTQGLVLGDGDVEAQLTGETFDGLSIFGTDAIRLVGSFGGQPIEDAPLSALSAVPEPAGVGGLLGLLLAGVLGWGRRGR